MQRSISFAIDCLNRYTVEDHGQNHRIIDDFTERREPYFLSLSVDPSIEIDKDKDEYGCCDAHDKPEVCILGKMIGSLGDGAVVGSTLFVFDDTHIVGVAGSENDDGKVEEHEFVDGELSVYLGLPLLSWMIDYH